MPLSVDCQELREDGLTGAVGAVVEVVMVVELYCWGLGEQVTMPTDSARVIVESMACMFVWWLSVKTEVGSFVCCGRLDESR